MRILIFARDFRLLKKTHKNFIKRKILLKERGNTLWNIKMELKIPHTDKGVGGVGDRPET